MNRQSLRAVVPLSLVLFAAPAFAQVSSPATRPPAPQAPAAPQTPPGTLVPAQAPYRPPAMRFDAAGMSLLDAIRITLQNDPTIKLRQTDIELQRGVVQSERGLFDALFRVDGNFGRDQVALLDSEFLDQQEFRSNLDAAIVEVRGLSDSLLTAGALLRDKNQAFNSPNGWNLATIKDKAILDQMTILQAELILYRDLLNSPSLTDATVRNDIINLREQTVGKYIDYFNTQQTAIATAPDDLQKKRDNLGTTPEEQWDKTFFFTAEVPKQFRSGLFFRPYVDLRYQADNYVGKLQYSREFGGLGVEPVSRGKIGFDVVLPLMRGLGSAAVAAGEKAATIDLEASRLVMLHQQSSSVLDTIEAYWVADAATRRVDVLRRSVEVQGELGNITRALIAANNRPPSEGARIAASTADARSRYEAGQRQLNDARIALAQAMGVALADALSLPMANDPFPVPPGGMLINADAYPDLIREAVAKRFDRQAALQAEASGMVLVEGARLDTKPVMDLNLSYWGTSVKQSSIGYGDWTFKSASIGVAFEKPIGNNTAAGVYASQRAALRSTQISSTDLERVIGLRVVELSESLKLAVDRLRSAEEAVRNYDQTIANEQTRLRAGDTSLIDTILTEQQATGARLSLITAQSDYASILAELRFEAGVLMRDGAIDGAQLTAVPQTIIRR